MKGVANILKTQWRAIGADVSVKVFGDGYFNQNIIRPRKYDALLFGQVINSDNDLYAFWDSSQRQDPGLNIALYSNAKADKALENIRTDFNAEDRSNEYAKFAAQVATDTPAIFLYSPDFIYVTSPKVQNVDIEEISSSEERFSGVYKWFIDTERVWKIFSKN